MTIVEAVNAMIEASITLDKYGEGDPELASRLTRFASFTELESAHLLRSVVFTLLGLASRDKRQLAATLATTILIASEQHISEVAHIPRPHEVGAMLLDNAETAIDAATFTHHSTMTVH